MHHWTDADQGLAELSRVARLQVIFTWDPSFLAAFWFTRDYLPEATALDDGFVTIEPTLAALGTATVEPVPVPHDCCDGFYAAYWRRPQAYFEPAVRAAISGFRLLDPPVIEGALSALAADLESGEWHRRKCGVARARARLLHPPSPGSVGAPRSQCHAARSRSTPRRDAAVRSAPRLVAMGAPFYPTGTVLPERGHWRLEAVAAQNRGCFELQL